MTTQVKDLINKVEEIRKKKGIPKGKFEPEIGVTSSAYQKWTYGNFEPKGENVLKIQEYIEDYEKSNEE